jgi:hypothetical protein
MVRFRIGYLSQGNIAIMVEHPEFGFIAPVIWFGNWESFKQFRDMVNHFYLASEIPIPTPFLKAFSEGDNMGEVPA